MQIDEFLRKPLSGSKKITISGVLFPEIRVPFRELALADGSVFPLYDTSGHYTDPAQSFDLQLGAPFVGS